MYPTQRHQLLCVAVCEKCFFVFHAAGVGGGVLLRDKKAGDEECVADECAEEDTAGFKITVGVG